MTAQEIIDILEKFDKNSTVYFNSSDDGINLFVEMTFVGNYNNCPVIKLLLK